MTKSATKLKEYRKAPKHKKTTIFKHRIINETSTDAKTYAERRLYMPEVTRKRKVLNDHSQYPVAGT
jgi:hypothetical protein